jgi:hypothetical protein
MDYLLLTSELAEASISIVLGLLIRSDGGRLDRLRIRSGFKA